MSTNTPGKDNTDAGSLIREWVKRQKGLEITKGEPFFMGFPDRWYETPAYGCVNGHISHQYLKSESLGALCLSCQTPLFLLPPETTETILAEILKPFGPSPRLPDTPAAGSADPKESDEFWETVDDFTATVKELESELSAARERISDLERERDAIAKDRFSKSGDIELLQQNLADLERERDSATQSAKDLSVNFRSSEVKRIEAERERDALQQKLAEVEAFAREESARIVVYDRQNAKLTKLIERKDEALSHLTKIMERHTPEFTVAISRARLALSNAQEEQDSGISRCDQRSIEPPNNPA